MGDTYLIFENTAQYNGYVVFRSKNSVLTHPDDAADVTPAALKIIPDALHFVQQFTKRARKPALLLICKASFITFS